MQNFQSREIMVNYHNRMFGRCELPSRVWRVYNDYNAGIRFKNNIYPG